MTATTSATTGGSEPLRFSEGEYTRRRDALESVLADTHADTVLIYGSDRSGSAVGWLTGWQVTREAAVVMSPGDADEMFVQFYNHVPAARRWATDAHVSWGGPSTIATAIDALRRRGAQRVGLIGPLGWRAHQAMAAAGFDLVDLAGHYLRLRLIKSAEEQDWMRRAAELSDAAILAVRDAATPGTSETELGAACEAAYLATGATNHIHYFGVTNMAEPDSCVPSQWPTQRRLAPGDVLTCEISANWWGYSGQVLRSMTVQAEPEPLYAELHQAADAAYDAICDVLRHGATPEEVVSASGVIEDAGFTIYDDLVHGYGGGYFPPILGSPSRQNAPLPDMVFEAGMTVVVQPNVITTDERAGVQTGGLVLVTEDGVEELQRAPRGFWRA
jgi:Xaa-Pro aminopeptidase